MFIIKPIDKKSGWHLAYIGLIIVTVNLLALLT